jgi:hypothetical protein
MSTSCGELLWLGAGVLYLALPVMAAGAVHIVVLRCNLLRRLKAPLDCGLSWRGRRLLGDNKTWRGALVMVGAAAPVMALQQHWRLPRLELFDYGRVSAWLCGTLLGLGFVLGELPNSFLKRRCDIAPGQQAHGARYWLFLLLDQIDSVVGGLAALALVWQPPWRVVAAALLLCSLAHIAFNLVFVAVGLKGRAL